MAVSRAYELGVKALSIPSAGNAAGAMSAYAALAGMRAYVYMPKDVPAPFIAECKALGAKVTLIEFMPHILPREDADLSKRLAAGLKKKGIDIRTGTKVSELTHTDGGVRLTLEGDKAGEVDVDLVLVGIGLECNSEVVTQTPGLGVKVGARGGIDVDERMETSVPGIYAIGDVHGQLEMLQ